MSFGILDSLGEPLRLLFYFGDRWQYRSVPSSKFVLCSISMNKVVLQTVHIIQLVRRMNGCGNG